MGVRISGNHFLDTNAFRAHFDISGSRFHDVGAVFDVSGCYSRDEAGALWGHFFHVLNIAVLIKMDVVHDMVSPSVVNVQCFPGTYSTNHTNELDFHNIVGVISW